MKALTEYSILDKSQVIAEVSVGTEHLEKNMGTIVARNPQYLVLHYGENELDHMDRAPYFIKSYKECLLTLKQRLPNTKIFVDSIWPVTAKANEREPLTKYIPDYNKLIKEMCKEVGLQQAHQRDVQGGRRHLRRLRPVLRIVHRKLL